MRKQKLFVKETFSSVQGESTHAGRLCFFIRLAGCNLGCAYCDTPEAKAPSSGLEVSVAELVRLAEESGLKLVEITGGEPLLQDATPALCAALLARNFEVMVETNGSLPISTLPEGVVRVMDCKCPSSGESGSNLHGNFAFLTAKDEVKFVIGGREDYDFALSLIRSERLDAKTRNLLLSPVAGRLDHQLLASWMLEDKVPARFHIQLHKIIWGQDAKGV